MLFSLLKKHFSYMGIIPIKSGATTPKAGSFLMASVKGVLRSGCIYQKACTLSMNIILFLCATCGKVLFCFDYQYKNHST